MKRIKILLSIILISQSLCAMQPEENIWEEEEETRPAKIIKTEPESPAAPSMEFPLTEITEPYIQQPPPTPVYQEPATPMAQPRVEQPRAEILTTIQSLAQNGQGPTQQARLYDAAAKIRSYLLSLRENEEMIKNSTMNAVSALARYYTKNDLTSAAAALATPIAGQLLFAWLNSPVTHELQKRIALEHLIQAIVDQDDERITFLITNFPNTLFPIASILGLSPLVTAATYGYLPVVNKALEAGADVNATDVYGSTALMNASANGHTAIVERLLAVPHININLTNHNAKTALDYARLKNHQDIVALLTRAGASAAPIPYTTYATPALGATTSAGVYRTTQGSMMPPPAPRAPAFGSIPTAGQRRSAIQPFPGVSPAYKPSAAQPFSAQQTISSPAPSAPSSRVIPTAQQPAIAPAMSAHQFANASTLLGTSLYNAARDGNLKQVKNLLNRNKKDVDINFQFGPGHKTPLMAAVENGHVEIVRLLLAQGGINVNQEDYELRTALDYALASLSPNKQLIVDLLRQAKGRTGIF